MQQNGSRTTFSPQGEGGQALIQTARRRQPTKKLLAEPVIPQRYLDQPDPTNLSEVIVDMFVPGSERATLLFESDHVVPRICGSWVRVLSYLPCLSAPNTVLSKAVIALAASILSRPNMGNLDCSQKYHAAVRLLRQKLGGNGRGTDFEIIPTIMCLTLMEVGNLIPRSY